MADRPAITPALIASLTGGAPKRIVRKLDQQPDLAERWQWQRRDDAFVVTTDSGETVTLTPTAGVVGAPEQVTCSCLLSPRCLHLLAVVTRLEVGGGAPAGHEPGEAHASELPAAVELREDQRAAAGALWRAAAEVVASGATATGAMPQAELLRAVHACRVAGLHRASATGVRVVRAIRDLRDDRAEFRLDALATELCELLVTAHRLRTNRRGSWGRSPQAAPVSLVGRARRVYEPIGNVRLYGLFSEPVIAGSGYAGVVTYLCDGDHRLFTVSDVLPGDAGRVRAAYRSGDFAGLASSHLSLSRAGMFVNGATASADGRLGRGAGVKAVTATGVAFTESPIDGLWSASLAAQLERHRQWSQQSASERPAGWNLLFLEGQIVQATDRSIVIATADGLCQATAASEHELLAYRHNLQLLGRAAGLRVRMIGRLRVDRPRAIDLLAIAGAELSLSESWRDRVNLGLDSLARSHLPDELEPLAVSGAIAALPDPFDALRRRLHRVALGGRATLPPEALIELDREVAALRRRMLPTAAELLRSLADAATASDRDISGTRQQRSEPLAEAWVRAALYERAATVELVRATWPE